jgi:hypothetical protein
MKVGVVLATYNGGRFLRDQLRSLSAQTRLPDHVVISDDASSDDTVSMAEDFRFRFPRRVDILRAESRQGPLTNFLRAAKACEAEIIAFCDQDDVWLPRKLAVCESAMRATPSWAAVHSLDHFREMTNGTHRIVSRTLVPDGTIDGLRIGPHRVFRGMSMVVRKSLLAHGWPLKQLWDSKLEIALKNRPLSLSDLWSQAHDMIAFMTARLIGSIIFIPEVLAHQRWHETNFSTNFSAGWGRTQDEHVSGQWGTGADVGHLALSRFCEEFAVTVGSLNETAEFPDLRRVMAVQHFEHWAKVWHLRATLYARPSGARAKIIALSKMAGLRTYSGIYAGGLGPKALCRDVAAIAGIGVT